MRKFSYLLLISLLCFFVLSLNKAEGAINFNTSTSTPVHNLQNDHSYNACAISIDNSFQGESLNFEEFKREPSINQFSSIILLDELLLNIDLHYLKACNFFNFNLTVREIIYPFHSFL